MSISKATPELIDELHRITPYDPDHLPGEIKLIEALQERYPNPPQVACFNKAFHRTMPRVAKVLPILNLNGYKISNPTLLAHITHEELEQ